MVVFFFAISGKKLFCDYFAVQTMSTFVHT